MNRAAGELEAFCLTEGFGTERLASVEGDLDSFCAVPTYLISSCKDQFTFGLAWNARAATEECKGQRGTCSPCTS